MSSEEQQAAAAAPSPVVPMQYLDQPMYHICVEQIWQRAVDSKQAYFPPTFAQDGCKTHASDNGDVLLYTANHFYKSVPGRWICLQLDPNVLFHQLGIVTMLEAPQPVGNIGVPGHEATAHHASSGLRYPHIYGGLPTTHEGLVTNVYPMSRDDVDGTFLSIEGLTLK